MKRQLRNYLIYFVTVAMTISLVFAMNNMIYNEDLQEHAESFASLGVGLLILSGFLCVIIAAVLGYANAFMLRLRKREFGTYLTLGMKRHQMVKLFLIENTFLGIFAILTGFLFGSLLYQGLMLLMSELLEYSFTFSFVSLKGVIVTLVMAIAIFVVTFIASSIYLKRVTIFDLIHGEKKVNKVQGNPVLSSAVTVVSAAAIVYAFYQFSILLEGVFKDNPDSAIGLLFMIVLLAVSITTFHIGLAKSMIYILLKSKRLRQKGTNQFILRQLSAALSSNAILLGLLAFLMAFAIIAANTGFLYKAVEEENIAKRYPFDVMGNEELGGIPPVSIEQAKQEIEKMTTIERYIETPFFTTEEVEFLKQTSWYDEEYTDKDVYMRESDLNILLKAIGEESIKLEDEFAIYSNMPAIKSYDFSKQTIHYNDKSYTYSHTDTQLPAYVWAYFVIVVPDEVIGDMKQVQTAHAIDLTSVNIDSAVLHEALSYQEPVENFFVQRSDYSIQSFERLSTMAFSAILIVGALYLGFVFILLAMAILALKTLSNISDDVKNYHILYRIGVSKSVQATTLAKQISSFFAFPIVVPLIISIPVVMISEKFIRLLGFEEQLSMNFLLLMIVAVIMLIYFIYFIVTLMITKKHVLDNQVK